MAVHKYIKKPTVIQAVKWDGSNTTEILEFAGEQVYIKEDLIILKTIVGEFPVSIGNYLLKEEDGEIRPCDANILKKNYEVVD